MVTVTRTSARPQREHLKPEMFTLPAWAHPELVYWIDEYKLIRDTIAGAKEVKAAREKYLPKFDGMDDDEYEAYLLRATYYNFTGRTQRALVGSVLRRAPLVKGIPERLTNGLERITIDNQSFSAFAQFGLEESLSLGRFGILVDMPNIVTTEPKPYLTGYTAENILDWETGENPKTGRTHLIKLILRELVRGADDAGRQQYFARYRVLKITNGVYSQELFQNDQGHAELEQQYSKGVVVPKVRGKHLEEIPFFLIGVSGSLPSIKVPPLLDIAALNVSHFQSYAHLEQGRFYTGFPIYNVESDGSDTPDYELGANRVWVTQKGCSARLLEFNGQGLKHLENALDIKEQQAASLGGRMMGVRTVASSESDNSMKLKERNEQALLLEVASRSDEAFTFALRMWAFMSGESLTTVENQVSVQFNKDFLFDGIGAREFRAIHSMYKDGVLPIEVVYHYLKKGDVIPDWMSIDEFKKLLQDMDSFPNQPDADARDKGFPDKKTELAEDRADEQVEIDAEIREEEAEQAEKDRKSQEKQVALAPKPAPGDTLRKKPGEK